MSFQVTGEMQVGEAQNAAAKLRRRNLGVSWAQYLLSAFACAGLFIGGMAGSAVAGALGASQGVGLFLGMILGGYAGFFAGKPVIVRLAIRSSRRRYASKGAAGPLPLSFGVDESGITYHLAGLTMVAEWSAVSEVFSTRTHWVFLSLGHGLFLPRRLLSGPEQERALLSFALGHMSDGARARSGEATAFLKRAA